MSKILGVRYRVHKFFLGSQVLIVQVKVRAIDWGDSPYDMREVEIWRDATPEEFLAINYEAKADSRG